MINPEISLFASSINVLLDECKEQIISEEPEEYDVILKTSNPFTELDTASILMEVEVEGESGYYDDDNEWIEEEEREINFYDQNHYEKFFDDIINPTNSIKIKNCNLEMIIAMAKEFIDNNELFGYGIVITDEKSNFINPFHPLVAYQIKENGIPFNNNFTAILYMFEDEVCCNESKIKKCIENNKNIIKHIKTEKDIDDYKINRENIEQKIDEFKHKDFEEYIYTDIKTGANPNYCITPTQLAEIGGVIFPYYGAIETRFASGFGYSRNLTIMLNGNIDMYPDLDEAEDTGEFYLQDGYNSTCIGKYSNSEWRNLKHMNIMTTRSMYINYVIPDDWENLVYASIKQSIKILEGKNNDKNSTEK